MAGKVISTTSVGGCTITETNSSWTVTNSDGTGKEFGKDRFDNISLQDCQNGEFVVRVTQQGDPTKPAQSQSVSEMTGAPTLVSQSVTVNADGSTTEYRKWSDGSQSIVNKDPNGNVKSVQNEGPDNQDQNSDGAQTKTGPNDTQTKTSSDGTQTKTNSDDTQTKTSDEDGKTKASSSESTTNNDQSDGGYKEGSGGSGPAADSGFGEGGGDGGGCFAAGTPVILADGSSKSIEKLSVGDCVLSVDKQSGGLTAQRVSHVWIRGPQAKVILRLNNRDCIGTTGKQPFFLVSKRRFVAAEQLSVGDELWLRNKSTTKILHIEMREQEPQVFNLTVENTHTYLVGRGVLVGNMEDAKKPVDPETGDE